MLLMVEEGIRGGMCQVVYKYAKANNKYMKNYNECIKFSYIEYLDVKISLKISCRWFQMRRKIIKI